MKTTLNNWRGRREQLRKIQKKKKKNSSYFFGDSEILVNFAESSKTNGALAHLARAFDWQSRGDQFESGMLHINRISHILRDTVYFYP